MTILSFKLDQLFTLLMPEHVVGQVIFPSEPDFVQTSLSIKSKFVIVMTVPPVTVSIVF
jgi:hypothetical protein